ncbi:MAG: hypothetical protein GEU88_16870 [Solirubrobacterales bacterium]|nr:hypothetical protein [Solirubrobacterales bacterium]
MDPGDRDVPLIAGRIHGIRVWRLDWAGGDARLRGFNACAWESDGRATVAECAGRWHAGNPHAAPDPQCACGLYATHPHSAEVALALLDEEEPPRLSSIAGVVEAWGRVELHEDGFRAQYARPVAFVLVGAAAGSDFGLMVGRIGDRYASATLELGRAEELVDHCRAHELGLSRPVVRSLVAGAPGPEVVEVTTRSRTPGAPAGRRDPRRARALLAGIRAHLATVAIAVVALAWYGFLGWVAVVLVIAAVRAFTDDPRPAFTARHLEVVEQALVRRGGEVRYVAVVRNASARQGAVAAFPRGRVLDRAGEVVARLGPRPRVEHRPTLLPGETGVVIDELPGRRLGRRPPAEPRFETKIVARHRAAPAGPEPFLVRSTDLDRDRCRLTASLEAPREVRDAAVALVARDTGGAISAAGVLRIGRVGAGRTRRELWRTGRGGCPRGLRTIHAYPSLTPDQARAE